MSRKSYRLAKRHAPPISSQTQEIVAQKFCFKVAKMNASSRGQIHALLNLDGFIRRIQYIALALCLMAIHSLQSSMYTSRFEELCTRTETPHRRTMTALCSMRFLVEFMKSLSSIRFLVGFLIELKLYRNPTKNLIELKLFINSTKNLIEPKLLLNPTKNRIELKLYRNPH